MKSQDIVELRSRGRTQAFGAQVRWNPTNGRVGPEAVVKALNVSENSVLSLISGEEACQVDKLTFETAKEVFGDSIVIRVTFAAHTGDHV